MMSDRRALLSSLALGGIIGGGFIPVYLLAGDHPALAPWSRWYVLTVSLLAVIVSYMTLRRTSETRSLDPVSREWLLVGAIAFSYAVATAIANAYRWRIHTLGNVDSAIVVQSMRYTLDQGRLLFNTIEKASHLGVHNSPVYLAILPLYALLRDPRAFLVLLPPIAIAISALPMYAFARRRLPVAESLLLTVAYLLAPYIMARSTGDLYEMTLLPPLLLWAILEFDRERLGAFAVAALLCLTIKESIAATILLFSILSLVRKRGAAWIAVPATLSALSLTLSYGVVFPAFGAGVSSRAGALLGALGDTPSEAVRFILSDPVGFLRLILTPQKIGLAYQIAQPLLFLPPLLGGEALLALPALAINLLAQGGSTGIRAWESVGFGPILYASTAGGIAWLSAKPRVVAWFVSSQSAQHQGTGRIPLAGTNRPLAAPGRPLGSAGTPARDLTEPLTTTERTRLPTQGGGQECPPYYLQLGHSPIVRRLLVIGVLFATLACAPYWLRANEYRRPESWVTRAAAIERIPAKASISAPDYMLARFAERDHLQLQTGAPYWAEYHLVDLGWIDEVRGHRIPEGTARQYEALVRDGAPELELIWSQDNIYLYQRRGQ